MSSEKTEQPTPKRLRDARKQGQVAKSKDIPTTSILLVVVLYFAFNWPWCFDQLRQLLLLPASLYDQPFQQGLHRAAYGSIEAFLWLVTPPIGLAMIAGIAGHFFQTGLLVAVDPLIPKMKHLNPAERLQQIFSMKNLFEFFKSCFKIGMLTITTGLVLYSSIEALMRIPMVGLGGANLVLGQLLFVTFSVVLIVFIILASLDYGFQKYQFLRSQRMAIEEVKREYKEMEGDPYLKSKRKQLHREMANDDQLQRARQASVIVVNPTHIAVALEYLEGETQLPKIVAMGKGALAKQILEIAKEEGIPIMRDIPLARSLFGDGHVDHHIPGDLIRPVAEVLRWALEQQQVPSNTKP